MMITETTISIALLANFITWYFTPLDVVREWITDKWVRLCVGLIYTQSIIQAILASMLAVFIKYMLEYVTKPESK